MDLESTNGTFLNDARLDAARYIELRENDVLKFGASTRDGAATSDMPAKCQL